MLLSIQETPDLSKALYTARVHSAKECQRADGQLSQGGQVPQMLSFCSHLSSAKDPGAAFETFVLSISVDKHPALRSAGNASCRPKWSVDVDPVFQELVESSSVRAGKVKLFQVLTVGVHQPQYLTKLV